MNPGMLHCFTVAMILASTAPTAAEELSHSQAIRAAMGLAALATEQCTGFRLGPQFYEIIDLAKVSAGLQKKTLDPIVYMKRNREIAAELIAKHNKNICETAAAMAKPGFVFERAQ